MPLLALYLIKFSVSLSIVWLFYQLFLRRLTFYNMNRWYLLGYSLLAFIIPLINIGPMVDKASFHQPLVMQYIPSISNFIPVAGIHARGATAVSGSFSGWSPWNYFFLLIVLGTGVLFVLSAGRWLSLRKFRRQAALIDHTGIRIYQVDEDIIPFSFGNAIYINQRLHSEKEWEDIILHEFVHIRQRHTVDILLAELLCILNWYNPFVWLLRHSIRQNLEFIADGKVLENGVDKKNYQYHLLTVIGEPRYRLANSFNFSSLKKRIIMMNKIRSARLHLLKLVFLLPLMAVLLLAFRGGYNRIFHRPGEAVINTVGVVVDVITRQPLEGVIVTDVRSGLRASSDKRGYFRMVIPVKSDSMRVDMHFSMDGYDDDPRQYFAPSVKETHGLIVDGVLKKHTDQSPYMMVPPFFDKKTPDNPGYEDALEMLNGMFREAEGVNKFVKMGKDHPDVALFYTTEDKERQIVILNSGEFEKYGYPGGPTVADMEKKYGELPDMMTPRTPTAGKGYLSQWQKIALEAEKTFHTSSPDVLHVIFPGDSRVIVVPVSGKPRYYDMDNADPKERPAFEKLYGKLPVCVPAPGFSAPGAPAIANAVPGTTATGNASSTGMRGEGASKTGAGYATNPATTGIGSGSNAGMAGVGVSNARDKKNATMAVSKADTIPTDSLNGIARPNGGETPAGAKVTAYGNPLIVLDGVMMPSGWGIKSIAPSEIFSVSVLKDRAALAAYGSRAADGVILITTKVFYHRFTALHKLDAEHPWLVPIYFVDGVETSATQVNAMNPDDIISIEVLKGDDAIRAYGEKAANGAVCISTPKTYPDTKRLLHPLPNENQEHKSDSLKIN